MTSWRFHTPDGVADILPGDCARKRDLETGIRNLFRLRGYKEIETPVIEFYDVYAAGDGFVPQEDLFKFFDNEGRILCLRFDGTVPVARCAATHLRDLGGPQRLCYLGEMFRANESGGGRLREFTQAGAEIVGVRTPESDAEIIGTAISATLAAGITDLQVSIGQVGFFKGLCGEWGLDEEVESLLPALIDSRQIVAIEELCRARDLPDSVRDTLVKLTTLEGTFDVVDELAPLAVNAQSRDALANLRAVLEILEADGLLDYVSVDLGMLQGLHYYSGLIFKGFTYGIGFPLFAGGRYDGVSQAFGGTFPATGFSMGVNLVMTALSRRGDEYEALQTDCLAGYAPGMRAAAGREAADLRSAGIRVELDCEGMDMDALKEAAIRRGIDRILFVAADGSVGKVTMESRSDA